MYTKDSTTNKSTANTIQNNTRDIQEDFQRVKDKARETRQALSQTAFDVKDKANELLAQSLKDVKTKSTDIQENIVTYVTANPVKAIGLALLAGVIASQLLRK
jgi:ElaB/YqjD/DUF883 family membrane-anchored ribosome-binding protein